MNEIKLFDALDNKVKVLDEDTITIYVCGPTTYDRIHIGNLRPIVFYDFMVRFFRNIGKKVIYAMNITDVDDKIINAFDSNQDSNFKNYLDYSGYYSDLFLKTYDSYDLIRPNFIPMVSTSFEKIEHFLDKIELKKGSYLLNEDLIFDTSKIKYGLLSNRDISKNNPDEEKNKNHLYKKNNSDFSLWKKTKDEMYCTKWSCGRPGWHSECVAFIDDIFNSKTITIHGGGIDLKFPHHENERVQFEVANNKPLAKFFTYVGHVKVENEKMSKSLNNFIYADDLLKKIDKNVIKMIIIFSNYKKPFEFSEQLIDYYNKLYIKIKNAINFLKQDLVILKENNQINYLEQFKNFVSNDFNMQNALMIFEKLLKEFNKTKTLNLKNQIDKIIEIIGLKI